MDDKHTSVDTDNIDLNNIIFDDWVDFETNVSKNRSDQNGFDNSRFNCSSTSFNTSSRLEISALCCDEEIFGFDKNTGSTWIYPTNYPVRDYQYNIVKASLFKNTLVSLPTGLGKTFIAAVVMYNFYRWYPLGKIIFTAPTRPLVAQQIEACYNIMAIPPEDTVEMTGSMPIAARKVAWQQKRVFFATPQVVQNDLESGSCPAELVRCLVIDEAHRARGRHAYCLMLEALRTKQHRLFRVLALSATPGSKVEDVINVVQNLLISHLELRSEGCIDVAMYSHSRSMQTIVVPLGEELSTIRRNYIDILDIYTRRLVQYKVLMGNIGSLSKGRVLMLFKEYSNREKGQRHPHHQQIMRDFTMVITLYHALELLTKHGSRVFLNFFDDHPDKTWVGRDDKLTNFFERLRDDLGIDPFSIDRSILPDGTIPEIKDELKYGHPKFDHLKNIIVDHFNNAKQKGNLTKAIVFCEYRESVNLVHCLLLQLRPTIKPHMFIGQGFAKSGGSKENMKSFSQKQQLRVMKLFREGVCNVLVSTCVGEEGLDVGNVDLIICFDISTKSPVRLVQRCGRTGRERGGRVVILVTEGREHQTLRDCILQRDSLNKRVLQSKELSKNLYSANPRMFPNGVTPECQKMFITVAKKNTEEKPLRPQKVQKRISNMLKKKSLGPNDDFQSNSDISRQQSRLTKEEFECMYPEGAPTFNFFEEASEHWCLTKEKFMEISEPSENIKTIKLSEWIEWQRTLQYSVNVDHSADTKVLSELLEYADSKRFNTSLNIQNTGLVSQSVINSEVLEDKPVFKLPMNKPKEMSKKKGKNIPKQIQKKHPDIRDLFKKLTNNEAENLFNIKLKETLADCGIENDDKQNIDTLLEKDSIPPILLDLMVELNIEKSKNNIFDTPSKYNYDFFKEDENLKVAKQFVKPSALLSNWILPNIDSLDIFTLSKNISLFSPLKTPKSNKTNDVLNTDVDNDICDLVSIDNISENVLRLKDEIVDNNNQLRNISKNDDFDFGNIDDIFGESSSPVEELIIPANDSCKDHPSKITSTEVVSQAALETTKCTNPLQLFDLDIIDDMFAEDSIDSQHITDNQINKNNLEIESQNRTENMPKSPILCSQKNSTKNNFQFNRHKLSNCSTPVNTNFEEKRIDSNNINQISKSLKHTVKDLNTTSTSKILNISNISRDIFCDTYDNFNNTNITSNATIVEKKDNTSLFTVTQIIDLINNESVNEKASKVLSTHNQTNQPDELEVQNDKSSHSPILFSQKMTKGLTTKYKRKCLQIPNVTVLESSESSGDENTDNEAILSLSNKLSILSKATQQPLNANKSISTSSENDVSSQTSFNFNKTPKRKLQLSDETDEFSHFFKKNTISPSVLNGKSKTIYNTPSLKEKLNRPPKTMNEDITIKCPLNESDFKETSTLEKSIHDKFENIMRNTTLQSPKRCLNHVSQLERFAKTSRPQWLYKQNQNILKAEDSKCKKSISESDSDDFVCKDTTKSNSQHNMTPGRKVKFKKKRKKKPISDFIDYEAALSDDSYEATSGDDSKNSDELNTSIAEFLCDEDHIEVDERVDMEAKYLQSVRSPVKTIGKFKIPVLPKNPVNVFSQVDHHENTAYELDSFCVDVDDSCLTQQHEMSELEIAEAILKKRKRRKRNQSNDSIELINIQDDPAGDSPIARNRKKRVCLQIDSESSTDEDLFL